jgi:hypothetical protein
MTNLTIPHWRPSWTISGDNTQMQGRSHRPRRALRVSKQLFKNGAQSSQPIETRRGRTRVKHTKGR